jgi:shikimate 5-dehydrogenase
MSLVVQATAGAEYPAAVIPTMYFIGVSTGQSSIMKIFPHWAEFLGLGNPDEITLCGVDCQLHDERSVYRSIVEHIESDPLSLGALVTTHKIDLLAACRDLFDELDSYAELMGEVSSISKRDGTLIGCAKDPITSGLALQKFLPQQHWMKTGGEVLVLGAGGSSIALTSYLMQVVPDTNRPKKMIVTDCSLDRLEEIRRVHGSLDSNVSVEYHHTPTPQDNDALINSIRPHSLVVNATGLGKDGPGSPITGSALFPKYGFAWDFNYRGDLEFLDQARNQGESSSLTIEDGWVYFLHGWTRVIAEVFSIDIPTSGSQFDELSWLAASTRN